MSTQLNEPKPHGRARHRASQGELTAEQVRAIAEGRPLAAQHLPGKARLKAVLKLAFTRVMAAEIGPNAAALAYYALLSLFPMMIMFGNMLPLFGFSYDGVTTYLSQVVPSNVMAIINPIIQNLLATSSGVSFSIGTFVTLWAASLAISGLKDGFNKAYGVPPAQNFFVQRILSMLVFFLLIVALVAVMVAFAFGRQFLEWLIAQFHLNRQWLVTFNTWRWPVTLTALVSVILYVDYFLPNVRIKFWTVLPGGALTIAGWLVLAQAFGFYMRQFGTRFSSYGTLGTLIVLLLWLNFSAMMWLIGAVLNAVVAEYYTGKPQPSRGKVADFFRRKRREREAEEEKSTGN